MDGMIDYRGFALHEGVIAFYTFPCYNGMADAKASMKSSALI